jgi:hypothetical protein
VARRYRRPTCSGYAEVAFEIAGLADRAGGAINVAAVVGCIARHALAAITGPVWPAARALRVAALVAVVALDDAELALEVAAMIGGAGRAILATVIVGVDARLALTLVAGSGRAAAGALGVASIVSGVAIDADLPDVIAGLSARAARALGAACGIGADTGSTLVISAAAASGTTLGALGAAAIVAAVAREDTAVSARQA